jgi:WH1 domain
MATETLHPEEISAVVSVIGCDPTDIHATAPVKLFTALPDQQSWHATHLVGIAAVHFDMELKVPTLRVIDINNKKILLEEECYDSFELQKLSDKFYSAECKFLAPLYRKTVLAPFR